MPIAIDQYSLAAKPIEACFQDTSLGTASAFTWATSEDIYLVTNWHVVTGLNPITGKHLSDMGSEPDRLIVQIDLRDPVGSRGPFELPLYDSDGHPVWLEHSMATGIDVVAIKLPPLPGVYPHPINLMPERPMRVAVGSDAFILGYPFGISTGAFPIWKRASVASEPEMAIGGKPFFYVDTASRKGMSGAPVSARTWGFYQHDFDNGQTGMPGAHSRLIGIYASRLGADDELQAQLGRVWRASLIEEIITKGRRGFPPWRYEIVPPTP